MALGPWSVNPAWQNFSSLFREANAAIEAPTDMEKSHHLTASLYFGIAALEAFLNQQMRSHMTPSKDDKAIFEKLRTGRFIKKLKTWPAEIIGRPTSVASDVIELIEFCNDVRGDLTHPKTVGHNIYERLFEVEPMSVVNAIATYVASFHEVQGTRYPYWLFGWNYLNPRPNTHEIILINDQQFLHSLAALGFDIPSYDYARAEAWKEKYMASVDGYAVVRDALRSSNRCEPKFDRFPFQPKLCRRWWTAEHHKTCGCVTEESLARARKFDDV
ncbi:MAG: hypothetical protein ACYDD9_03940 [Acidithiobacillus sp.]|jgi:hypothetical protein